MIRISEENRWVVVIGAVLIQLCLGAIYAWSVFTEPLKSEGWSGAQTQAVFSAGLASFAIVMVLAGRLLTKWGPRRVAMAGGVVLGLGYMLAGIAGGTDFFRLLVFIGLIGGSGIGLAYVVPIAVGIRWFPDKKGLISGLAVAGFGFGATLWVKLAGSWGDLIADVGLSKTLTIYGAVFLVVVLVGGLWMLFPPEGYKPAGWNPARTEGGSHVEGVDLDSSAMLRTPQFYMILLTFAVGAGAGLMSIGLMKLFPKPELMKSGLDQAAASAVAGTAMAVFFALANGLGRIAWGAISDRAGRRRSIIIMMATQGVFVFAFRYMAGNPALLYLGAALIGFNFGGNFALFPTITADTFGTRHVGQNYGWVFLAYGVGGIFGPMLGGRLGDLDNFSLAFSICGLLCLAGALLIRFVRPPKR
jgi:OFA family oxalate/formate antiporter-like MFS transporter